jgi:hypothetical protein
MSTPPASLPAKYRPHWSEPWTARARRSPGFRLWLARHGYLTPHFTLAEAASHDGIAVPRRMRPAARDHAFRLERLRHALGDVPVPITSWYRSPARNRAVGGAAKSWHMRAVATDHPVEFVHRHPSFDRLAAGIWSDGGFGQYPGGARHVDTRGFRARWTTYTPGR